MTWGVAGFIRYSFIRPFTDTRALLIQIFVGLFLGVAFATTVLSGVQGFVLRRLIQRRGWWIIGSVCACVLGVVAGFLSGGIAAAVLGLLVPSAAPYVASVGFTVGGGVGGAAVALVQRFGFRPAVRHGVVWVGAWAGGAALGVLIALGLEQPDFVHPRFMGFAAGGVFGIVTGPVLGLLWLESLSPTTVDSVRHPQTHGG